MINNNQQIKDSSIKAVIEQYLPLKKQGVNFVASCPFHDEKTNSFFVSPHKHIWKCFGCGQGGNNAVSFLMEYKHLTYPEALEEVAKVNNILVQYEKGSNRKELIEQTKKENEEKRVLIDIQMKIWEWWQSKLEGIQLEKVDFAGRIYSIETIKKFGLVWHEAGDIYQNSKIWGEKELLQLGLLRQGENNVFELLKDRYLFPIYDHRTQRSEDKKAFYPIVGYGGRQLKELDKKRKALKYINTPDDSPLYNKSKLLYGLAQNFKGINREGYSFLVEGYTDVVSLSEYGFDNAVAACGTSLSIEQAKLLSRYTDTVFMLYDGDSAGLKAARRSIFPLLQECLNVKLCILPPKQDPDSYVRKIKKGFDIWAKETAQDAVLWYVMEGYDKKDPFKANECIDKAAKLLSLMKSAIRQSYIKTLTERAFLGSVKKILEEKINELEEEKLSYAKDESDLSPEQEQDLRRYGIFSKNNKYYSGSDGSFFEISNFIINPIMLVIGSEQSRRIIEVTNEHGHHFFKEVDSDDMIELGPFKKVVARHGNFLFKPQARGEHFAKVLHKVFENTPDCYPINTLGYHSKGFWSWGNGISTEGKFINVDEFGRVDFENQSFYLPAFSRVRDQIHSDEEDGYEEQRKNYIFISPNNPETIGKKTITFKEWGDWMVKVFLTNGAIGVSYYLAALFRDIIYSKFNFFPHLNGFGQPSSGKSGLGWSISSMFGVPLDPFHLVHGTAVGFFRRLAKFRNGLAWLDEYSNDVPYKRQEAMKAAYDGVGHEKGTMSNDNRTIKTKVQSAIYISGQQQPTFDIALFTRCISMNFTDTEFSEEQKHNYQKFRDIGNSGICSQITSELQQYRQLVQRTFYDCFEQARRDMTARIEGFNIPDRIQNNHLICLAMVKVFLEKLPMPFTYVEILEVLAGNMIRQAESISNQNETSRFWDIMESLIEAPVSQPRRLIEGLDYLIEEKIDLTVKVEGEKNKTRTINFGKPRKILFFRFTRSFGYYTKEHRERYNKNGLDIGALQHYLKGCKFFVGAIRAKKFGNKACSCYAFDMDREKLGFPFEIDTDL
jgi:DNA primase catalytic core